MTDTTQVDVLIVGAGVAGMLAAHTLRAAGATVQVLDKGYYPGGRLASKTLGPELADIGAQFFTARDPAFQTWADRWLADDLIFEWSFGWSDGSLGSTPGDGQPRYAARGGMRSLARKLADGLPVKSSTRIVQIALRDNVWVATDDQAERYRGTKLLMTPPVPQSLLLLDAGEVPLSDDDLDTLDQITYDPCLAGVFWVHGPVRLPEPGALQSPNAAISWLADNQRKGIAPSATLITVHAGPAYSHQLWPMPDWEILVALESGLRRFKEVDTEIAQTLLHRWRYAVPAVTHEARYLQAEGLPALVFAGDAFGGPRVEGAALSGLAAAQVLAGS